MVAFRSRFTFLLAIVYGLRFDILASPGMGTVRCVEQFITAATTVRGNVDVPNKAYQKIQDADQNRHYSKLNIFGPQKFSFTANKDSMVTYCFTNVLDQSQAASADLKRSIFLQMETAAPAEVKSTSRFSALEQELAYLSNLAQEAITEMIMYDKQDELMDQVNVNTKERVFNSSSFSILAFVALGIWEVWYLKEFFKAKNLI